MTDDKDIEVLPSLINGNDIFARRKFEIGEKVLHWDTDKRISRDAIADVSPGERHYLLDFDESYLFIIQPPERHINHSCNPNTKMGNLCDVAIRTISPGEEITSDYSQSSYVSFECHCGSENYRGRIEKAL